MIQSCHKTRSGDNAVYCECWTVLSVFQSVSPGSGNCINYGSIEDDKQKQTQKKVREG